MKLAELIRRALTDPAFRLALETGGVSADSYASSPIEFAAAAEALRSLRDRTSTDIRDLIPTICLGHRDDD